MEQPQEKGTISILVDDFHDVQVKGMLPPTRELFRRAVDVSTSILQQRLDHTLSEFFRLLSSVTLEANGFEVDSVSLALSISSSGEVSLASLAKGSLSGQTTIELNIRRRVYNK